MRGFVAVTDRGWYDFLSARQPLDEVNFWQPRGAVPIRNLEIGEPFLFKLHAPENFIVGVGFFTTYSALPVSLAWEAFGEKNGAGSLLEMRERITRFRRDMPSASDYTIGCVVLTAPCFFPRSAWVPMPADYPLNAVRGKTYDLSVGEGLRMWMAVGQQVSVMCGEGARTVTREAPVGFAAGEVFRRLGQGGFRILVTDAYQRRCAVTGEKILPVLQAAHIKPVTAGGSHGISNGLLLRSDVHTLLDRGYVTVTPSYRVEVSRRLRDEFDNGQQYYRLAGSQIALPSEQSQWPDRQALEWHADAVFLR